MSRVVPLNKYIFGRYKIKFQEIDNVFLPKSDKGY